MSSPQANEIFEKHISLGLIPSPIGRPAVEECLIILNCFIEIERNTHSLPNDIYKSILEWQINYSDMFMQTIIQDQKRNNNISRIPPAWFEETPQHSGASLDLDDQSYLSCYGLRPFSTSILEFENVPLLKFQSASQYVALMLALFSGKYEIIPQLTNSNEYGKEQMWLSIDKFGRDTRELLLAEVLMYKAIAAQAYQNTEFRSEILKTTDKQLISKVTFPTQLLSTRGINFFGNLLMKIRKSIAK